MSPIVRSDSPLRVCAVVAYDMAEEGGVKRNAMHVAGALARRGDQVCVIGPMSRAARRAHRAAAADDGVVAVHGFGGVVNIRGNGSDNRLGLFSSPVALRRFLRDGDFDVVHVHEPLLPALGWWAVAGSRDAAHVCTFHGYAEGEGLVSRAARRALGALLFPAYERGIAVSEPAATFAARAWDRPLTLIPNGVPTWIYTPPAEPRPAAGRPLRVLFVGHFRDERKGLPYLLEAVRSLQARGVAIELDVVGKGGPGPLPDAPPGVTFHGPVSSEAVLAEHYRRADVFAATATGQESFGIVVLEAMSSGLPVVASEIAGYRQVVRDEGARFVPPADPAALAAALGGLAADPAARAAMGAANRRRAEEFDWNRLADRVREQYLLAVDEVRWRRAEAPAQARAHAHPKAA